MTMIERTDVAQQGFAAAANGFSTIAEFAEAMENGARRFRCTDILCWIPPNSRKMKTINQNLGRWGK